jgi:hypothetical protein
MQNQERTLASQLGPFFDQPPETPQEERAESIANQPILIISSDSSTTDEEDDEEEEEEEEDDTDEEPVIFDTVRAPTNRPQRQQLPRLVSSIAGYRSLSRVSMNVYNQASTIADRCVRVYNRISRKEPKGQ